MNWQKNASALLSVCLGLAAYSSASAFSVGNATPASVYFVQGQSFTPADLGNAGSGTPHADSAGNAHLVSLHIAFAAGQTPPSTLYIYSTLPTNGNATTGVGSIASAPDSGGGTYVFNPPVSVPFSSQTFAVLPTCANIYDAPDSYPGGTDLYPVGCPAPGSNQIVQGTFDIGFTATFVDPPVVAPASLPNGTVGTAYNDTVSASQGTAPYAFAVTGALPGGLTFNGSTGALSGTPTAGGTFNFTVTATDSSPSPGPYSGSQAYTLVIAAAAQTITLTAPGNIQFAPGSTTATTTATATASSGLPVTLTSATPAICNVSGSGPSFTVNLVATGTCTLNANQAGDANFLPAAASANIIVVAAPAPTPAAGKFALLVLGLLLALIGFAHARRA